MSHPRTLLNQLEANPLKRLSQNFLTSPHWAERLSDLTLHPSVDEVWEIGPGLGALTEQLLKKSKVPVRAFEFDRKLAAYLRATHTQLDLIEGDVMDADMNAISPGKTISLLSNLPYHLSSAIFFKMLGQKERLAQMVLTFQREFAERMIAAPRTEAYGALSVIAQLHFRIESAGILPPGAFYPAPGVSSEALIFTPLDQAPISPEHTTWVIKAAFQQRRKQMAANLRKLLPSDAPIESALQELQLSPTVRAEELTKDQFIQLTDRLRPFVCSAVCET